MCWGAWPQGARRILTQNVASFYEASASEAEPQTTRRTIGSALRAVLFSQPRYAGARHLLVARENFAQNVTILHRGDV